MSLMYIFTQLAIVIFAITGVLGAVRKDRDIFGLVVLGTITAVGGGTIRDVILDIPIFWIEDFNYIWISIIASTATFFLLKITSINKARYKILLYLDGLGMALFCIQAFDKTTSLGFPFSVAIIMAMLTGQAGGVMRDVLSGRPNLLITKELYASPALLGCILYALLDHFWPSSNINRIMAISFIFIVRSICVYFDIQMPNGLVNKRETSHH